MQHQLTPRLSVTAGNYRNWSTHFDSTGGALVGGQLGSGVADNLAVTPGDFEPYCVTAPRDPRLLGGAGYQVCGLSDVVPAKFGLGQRVVRRPSNYGNGQSRTSDFVTFSVNGRVANGVEYGASLDTGRSVDDKCFVVDSRCRQFRVGSSVALVEVDVAASMCDSSSRRSGSGRAGFLAGVFLVATCLRLAVLARAADLGAFFDMNASSRCRALIRVPRLRLRTNCIASLQEMACPVLH